jgi:hypothetical protein
MGGGSKQVKQLKLGCEKLFFEGHKLSRARDALRTPKYQTLRYWVIILSLLVDLLFDIHGTMTFPRVVQLFEFFHQRIVGSIIVFEFSKNRWFYNCK